MTAISLVPLILRVKALGLRLWLAALSLRKDYQTEAALQEFNELDSDNFLDDL